MRMRFVLTALLALSLAGIAQAQTISVGMQGGYHDIELPLFNLEGGEGEGGFFAPVFDFTWGRAGLTFKYLRADYTVDEFNSTQNFAFEREVIKEDFDIIGKYAFPLPGVPMAIVPFSGIRLENTEADSTGPNSGNSINNFDVIAIPVGATVLYSIRDIGLSPYVVGAIFPYANVDREFDFTEGGPNERPTQTDNGHGFGGWTVEAGAVYSLQKLIKYPVSASLSYRYQDMEIPVDSAFDYEERLHQFMISTMAHFDLPVGKRKKD